MLKTTIVINTGKSIIGVFKCHRSVFTHTSLLFLILRNTNIVIVHNRLHCHRSKSRFKMNKKKKINIHTHNIDETKSCEPKHNSVVIDFGLTVPINDDIFQM